METDTLTLYEALIWMSALASWLDEQPELLRWKGDNDSFMDPKQTARVLRTLLLTQGAE